MRSQRRNKTTKKRLGSKTGSMKPNSILRPKTAKSKINKGKSKKPIDKKILENNWNPPTSTAYGVRFGGQERLSPEKQKKMRLTSSEAMNKTQNLREKSLEKFSKLNTVDKERIQKVDKQLNDEVSRAFDEMAKILSKC